LDRKLQQVHDDVGKLPDLAAAKHAELQKDYVNLKKKTKSIDAGFEEVTGRVVMREELDKLVKDAFVAGIVPVAEMLSGRVVELEGRFCKAQDALLTGGCGSSSSRS
jgi:hypothetical protein